MLRKVLLPLWLTAAVASSSNASVSLSGVDPMTPPPINATHTSRLNTSRSAAPSNAPAGAALLARATAACQNGSRALKAVLLRVSLPPLHASACAVDHARAAAGGLTRSAKEQLEHLRWHLGNMAEGAVQDAADGVRQRVEALRGSARRLWRTYWRRDRAVSRILRRAHQKQWYMLLQLRRRASKRKLKEGYRRLARRVHPDKSRDDRANEAFRALKDAFDLLSDDAQRTRYDKELERQDELARRRREQQRAAAVRMVRGLAARVWRLCAPWCREHWQVCTGVGVVLFLRLTL